MARTLRKYSVVESGNITLGQAGVAFLTGTSTYTPPSGLQVVAIQFAEDSLLDSADATTAIQIGLRTFKEAQEQTVQQLIKQQCHKV